MKKTASREIRNTTIADNSGIGVQVFSPTGSIAIGNTILSNNSGTNAVPSGPGASITSIGSNITDDASPAFIGLGDMVTTDALLGSLDTHGGTTLVYSLLPGSPAIDSGDDVLATDENGAPLATDQRGSGFGRNLDGDSDGDRDVDLQDFGAFRQSLLTSELDAGFKAEFDFDGDGDIDGQEYGQMRRRLNSSLGF